MVPAPKQNARLKRLLSLFDDEDKLLQYPGIIKPGPGSRGRGRLLNPDIPPSAKLPLREKPLFFLRMLPNLAKIQKAEVRSIDSISQNPKNPKLKVDADFIALLESELRGMGVKAIGYTTVPEDLIFKNKGILYRNVIVLSYEMNRRSFDTAPSFSSLYTAVRTYAVLGDIANAGTDFLRRHGYGAQAGPSFGGLTFYPGLAERAGLGVRGRNGLLISPDCGPCQRLAVIYTSIENLPVTGTNVHAWVRDFCAKCGKCVRMCPGEAILKLPIDDGSSIPRHVIAGKCYPQFDDHYSCGICIKVCPLHVTGYDSLNEQTRSN